MTMSMTDLKRWRDIAQRDPPSSWNLRVELASYFIRPGDVVCDLGAGAQVIRRLLPPSTEYIPVDCVKEHDDTFVVDFNERFSLPNKPFNVILCLGLFRHLNDLPQFLDNLATTQPGKFIIFTYGFRKKRAGNHRSQKPIETLNDGLRFFSRYVEGLMIVANIARAQNRYMFCGTLRKIDRPVAALSRRSLRDIICSNTSLVEFGRVRIRKLGAFIHLLAIPIPFEPVTRCLSLL